MRLRVIRLDLPLRHVAIVSGSTISGVRALAVELDQDGLRGYGEINENPRFGVNVEKTIGLLEKMKEKVSHYALADPCAFFRTIEEPLRENKSAQCALEMAACDLWGKLLNRPLWRLWELDVRNNPLSSYTLTLDSVYRILEKYEECPNWPIYRIKLGSTVDMDILRELRKRTESPFRVDVNGSWSLHQTLAVLDELKDLNVELIEQPLPQNNWEEMAVLHQRSPIPIIADESCQSTEDIKKCAECFDGVNLKPFKFGGLFPTLSAVGMAKELGLKTMIGTTFESTISASASSQFAPILDYIYIDGPLLIDKKLGNGVQLDNGKIVYPRENGTGIRFGER